MNNDSSCPVGVCQIFGTHCRNWPVYENTFDDKFLQIDRVIPSLIYMYRYTNHEKNTFWGILIFFFWGGDFNVDYKNDILKTFQKNFNKGTIPVQCKTTCKYYVCFEKYISALTSDNKHPRRLNSNGHISFVSKTLASLMTLYIPHIFDIFSLSTFSFLSDLSLFLLLWRINLCEIHV